MEAGRTHAVMHEREEEDLAGTEGGWVYLQSCMEREPTHARARRRVLATRPAAGPYAHHGDGGDGSRITGDA